MQSRFDLVLYKLNIIRRLSGEILGYNYFGRLYECNNYTQTLKQ